FCQAEDGIRDRNVTGVQTCALPISLVQTGDWIDLDVAQRALTLEVDDAELARRRAQWQAPESAMASGYQKMYFDHVQQAHMGADLDFLVGCRGAEVPRESH